MEYINLEEVGTLKIIYDTEKPLDLYSTGILYLHHQEIIDKIAFSLLEKGDFLAQRSKRFRRRILTPFSDQRIIRAEIQKIEQGSWIEEIGCLIPTVLADPNVRAVLHGLIANIVFQIGVSGICGIQVKKGDLSEIRDYRARPSIDPEIEGNLRDITLILAENGGGEITYVHKMRQDEKRIVKIKVNRNN